MTETPTQAPTGAPSTAEISQIVGNADSTPAEMNRLVTNAYHRLSEAVRHNLDAGPNLDWCGFAKWSSATVGAHLDPRLVPARIDILTDLIIKHLDVPAILRPAVVDLLRQASDVEDGLVVKALRLGNAAIFREMGAIFARLVERLPERTVPNAQSDREFAEEVVEEALHSPERFVPAGMSRALLRTPPTDSLVHGIELYLRAGREPQHLAELMLAGNMLFSTYEQAAADRLIAIGSCAPVRSKLLHALRSVGLFSADDSATALLAGRNQAPFPVPAIENPVLAELTDLAMVVVIAGQRIRLGHPEMLPPPPFTPTLPEVSGVLAEVAARAGGHRPNWIDLDYRLGFIGRYFAALQQDAEATQEPGVTSPT
jgi:hypothetical protein